MESLCFGHYGAFMNRIHVTIILYRREFFFFNQRDKAYILILKRSDLIICVTTFLNPVLA